MALTDTQKATIRLYLGYPDQFRYRNTRLESVMDNLSPEAEVQISTILTALATVESQILVNVSTSTSGVKRVDEITFFDPINGVNIGFKNGKEAGRYFAGRLSIITGVPIQNSAFNGSGYGGDSFFPGFGNPINFG